RLADALGVEIGPDLAEQVLLAGRQEVGLDDFAGIGLRRLARDPHLLCRPEPEQPVPPGRGFEFKLLVMGEFSLETLLAILETRHLACRPPGPLSIRGCGRGILGKLSPARAEG